jgi:6-phosphogluconolactonase/glucosamine-6-phosphate isomerase/deaminase
MAKPKNPVASEKLEITTTPQVIACLQAIALTGLYGKNKPEVADRLLSRGIEELVKARIIPRPKKGRG